MGGSQTTRQCSSTGARPAGGKVGGFGVSWVSVIAGGAGWKVTALMVCLGGSWEAIVVGDRWWIAGHEKCTNLGVAVLEATSRGSEGGGHQF